MTVHKRTFSIKTIYGTFRCLFELEKDMGGYTAEALEVQGAVTWGKTLAEAKRMIVEAIEGAIETRVIARARCEGMIRMVRAPRLKAVAWEP